MLESERQLLRKAFKTREAESARLVQIPDGAYLCIRMDGFKMTGKFLRDRIINEQFDRAISAAHYKVFCSMRHHLNREFTSGFVCSYIQKDEVSMVLSKDVSNFERKVIKLCTLFSGMMSSALTQEMKYEPSAEEIMAFDARPIILNSPAEISEYIRSQYLDGLSYAYWKPLRLNNYDNANDPSIKNNIENAKAICDKTGCTDHAQQIISTYKLCIPEKQNRPEIISIDANDRIMDLGNLETRLNEYLDYLHNVQRI